MSLASSARRTSASCELAVEIRGGAQLPPATDLPSLLRGYRKREGLTMQAASALVPVARTVWRTWENQDVVPTPANLQRLSELLGLAPAEIRGASGPDRVRNGHGCVCGRPH